VPKAQKATVRPLNGYILGYGLFFKVILLRVSGAKNNVLI